MDLLDELMFALDHRYLVYFIYIIYYNYNYSYYIIYNKILYYSIVSSSKCKETRVQMSALKQEKKKKHTEK